MLFSRKFHQLNLAILAIWHPFHNSSFGIWYRYWHWALALAFGFGIVHLLIGCQTRKTGTANFTTKPHNAGLPKQEQEQEQEEK